MIDSRTVSIPVMGRIAAGVPISAIQNHTHDIACPPDLLTNGEHFALEVKGDSMIEAGIHDGDTVIIRRCDTAENGDIIVALVEQEEATLKRLRKKGSTIALEAANPEFKTRIFRTRIRSISRDGWSASSGVTDRIQASEVLSASSAGDAFLRIAGCFAAWRTLDGALAAPRAGRPRDAAMVSMRSAGLRGRDTPEIALAACSPK